VTGASQQALAVGLALAGSAGYAIAAVTQQRAATQLPSRAAFDPGILVQLARARLWQLSLIAMIAGFGLQAAALDTGRLVLVEPVFPATLLFALLLAARIEGRWLRRAEWTAALATVAGLVVFLFAAWPSGGQRTAGVAALTGAVIAAALLAGLCYLVAGRFRNHHRALVLGLAGGIGAGVTDALTKSVTYVVSHHGLAVFADVRLYLLAIVGIITFTLQQNGFRAASLSASMPAYAVLEPVVGSILGIVIYDEDVGLGAGHIIVEVLAVSCAIWGIIRLAQMAGTAIVATAHADEDVDSMADGASQPSAGLNGSAPDADGSMTSRVGLDGAAPGADGSMVGPAGLDGVAPDGSMVGSAADRAAASAASQLAATPPVDPVP
jgi:hypothetical protein